MSRFPLSAQNLSDPSSGAAAVSVHDTEDIDETRGLYVGTGGAMKVNMANGDTVTFSGVVGGTILPIRVTRVYDTDTTADNIVALY